MSNREKSQFKWPNRFQELSDFRNALKIFDSRKTNFNQTQIVEKMQEVSMRCKIPFSIDASRFNGAINGNPARHLGYDLSDPVGLLLLTVVFMIGRTHSVIPTEEALHYWLYDVCPDLLTNDDGRKQIEQKAPQIVKDLGYQWPVERQTEPSIPSFSDATVRAEQYGPDSDKILTIIGIMMREKGHISPRSAIKATAMIMERVSEE